MEQFARLDSDSDRYSDTDIPTVKYKYWVRQLTFFFN